MKKTMRHINLHKCYGKAVVFIIAAVLLIMSAFPVFAQDGNVTYEGQAAGFIFEPGTEYSPTDLFPNFKDVMPGDLLTQKITVKNEASKKVKVKIYMRSLGAEEGSEEFLSQMNLNVKENGSSELFDAPADQTDGLTEWTCLGTFYSGASVDLDVTLDVPITIGNDFQEAIGYLDWQFRVEEFPIDEDDPTTGDRNNPTLYIVIICVCAAAIIGALIIFICKKNKKNK